MAVYGGARSRGIALPRIGPSPAYPVARGGVRTRGRTVALPRAGRVGGVLGSIVVLFLLAFLWLAQSVRVSATSYDIVRLASHNDRLNAQARDLESDLSRLSGQPAIRKLALDAGLGQLDSPIVLPAR
jgi:hypothetical protein